MVALSVGVHEHPIKGIKKIKIKKNDLSIMCSSPVIYASIV